MSSTQEILDKAIGTIKQATDEDNKANYQTAYDLYRRALEYFHHVLKYDKNPRVRETVKGRFEHYLQRAETLKEMIKNGNTGEGANGGSATATAKKDSKTSENDENGERKTALSSAILSHKPNVKWSDVAGLEQAKAALQEAVILPVRFPHLFTGKRKPWRGILLYGPPGTGKSYLAQAVATEADSTFFSVSSSDLVTKWQGESEKLVRSLFEMARENAPAIIFIDEIDSLATSRSDQDSESSRRVKTEFLVQMQGVGKDTEGVLVLAATNLPWNIDSAIRRRFERRIYIPLPDIPARQRMFRLHLGDTPHSLTEEDFHQLAVQTEHFSGSDIATIVRDALMEPVRRVQNATHFRIISGVDAAGNQRSDLLEACSPGDHGATAQTVMEIDDPTRLVTPKITMKDFLRVMQHSRPSVGVNDLGEYEDFTRDFGQEG